jgi:hypothetical protein
MDKNKSVATNVLTLFVFLEMTIGWETIGKAVLAHDRTRGYR